MKNDEDGGAADSRGLSEGSDNPDEKDGAGGTSVGERRSGADNPP
jgi:hypothetical protein